MILSISGLHGTGKSTIAKLIAEALGIKYYSTGQAFRDLAIEMDMTLEEFTKYVEDHPEIDNALDDKVVEVAKEGNVIIDSQLSGHLLKGIADLRIHLTCPLETRVKRIASRDERPFEESMKETILRETSELERFKLLYNIDLSNFTNIKEIHDIILGTEGLTIEQVLQNLLQIIKDKNLKKS